VRVAYEPISQQEVAHQLQMRKWAVGIGVLLVLVGVIVFFVSPGPTGPSCSASGGSTICSNGGPSPGEILGAVIGVAGVVVVAVGLFSGLTHQRRVIRGESLFFGGPAKGEQVAPAGGGDGVAGASTTASAGSPAKFCESCGAQLNPTAKFCRACGQALD